jgi:hypothetical protein
MSVSSSWRKWCLPKNVLSANSAPTNETINGLRKQSVKMICTFLMPGFIRVPKVSNSYVVKKKPKNDIFKQPEILIR